MNRTVAMQQPKSAAALNFPANDCLPYTRGPGMPGPYKTEKTGA